MNVKLDPLGHRYTARHKCPSRERQHSPPHAMNKFTRSLRALAHMRDHPKEGGCISPLGGAPNMCITFVTGLKL